MTDSTDNFFPPSINPASRGDYSGMIRFVLTKWLQKTDDMLPAVVVSYNRQTNRATVQPLISIVDTNNNLIQRGVIASVPVLQIGGGGFVLSCPLNAGDLGWIKASDRDISLFIQSFQNSPPNTARLHSFEDGMFIPDTMFKNVVINSEDEGNIVLQTTDGTVRVAIWPNKVKVTAPEVDIVAPVVDIKASTSITLDTPIVTFTGNLTQSGGSGATATFSGSIVATGEVTGSGKVLGTHVHSGVQTGSGDTGPPV